ncbi:hypothetical protein DFP75_101601 [Marinomonas alcarazii]|uniref:Uncharacterized protein n=1 Tax=Marinomonas alcarazii TaxID=491949 RepID=A0A318V902_9GAMM|nr:hypothetical protein DFP75_101601 [Marinomonas alcarazii]
MMSIQALKGEQNCYKNLSKALAIKERIRICARRKHAAFHLAHYSCISILQDTHVKKPYKTLLSRDSTYMEFIFYRFDKS